MKKKFKSVVTGKGNDCPKCLRQMDRYSHGKLWKPKKDQPYFFKYWDRCFRCRHLQHYEEAKEFLNNQELQQVRQRTNLEQKQRINSIKVQLGIDDDTCPF